VVLARYESKAKLLHSFNPGVQTVVMENVERAFTGLAPTLTGVKIAFGVETSETWLMAQIEDLNEYCGTKEKASFEQMLNLSKLLIIQYGYLKITEMMLFFCRLKLGRYGTFYGSVDPMVISKALMTFIEERREYLNKFEREQENRRRADSASKVRSNEMTYSEWIELKWLFNYII